MIRQYNQPTAFVIFGGTGDLAKTKLFPALFSLFNKGGLPDSFIIISLSRKEMTNELFKEYVASIITKKGVDNHLLEKFCAHLRYVSGNFDDALSYEKIKDTLTAFDESIGVCTSKLFYLAVPPMYYSSIFKQLKESDAMSLCDQVGSWSRLLVEKPFGRDLETANALEEQLCHLFTEDQIYRIDHYLEKDAIENILTLRFANRIFADIWNKDHIESFAISLYEEKDVANRGAFYDGIGALRDVGQNHMLQILSLLGMKYVDLGNSRDVRNARRDIVAELTRNNTVDIIRAQYEGFRETNGVDKNSETETYFSLKTEIDNDTWRGVPIVFSSGKALDTSKSEVVVTFRPSDQCHCGKDIGGHTHNNVLTIQLSPVHVITLTMWVKKPGFDFVLEKRELVLARNDDGDRDAPEAYERVLFDCIVGDQARFVSGDEVRVAWEFITPILERFKTLPLLSYQKGTKGPTAS